MTTMPTTKYAKSGDVHIAYQVVGEGAQNLVLVPGWVSHIEYAWEDPSLSHFLRRLASFSRLILLDRRGTGLSDRVTELPSLEQRMDDVRAVMDAAGVERAALFGLSEGGPMCLTFAAIIHRVGDHVVRVENARYIAERIQGAKYVELPGPDHFPFVGDTDAILDEVEEFLTGARRGQEPDRVLATVMFTDIVGATERAVALGDRRWRDLLDRHHAVVREQLSRFRGREIDTAGDGFLAAFDGPARAVRCAGAIVREMRHLGLEIRAGLHTGECELLDDKLSGVAVHTGARVASLAVAGEVLVSGTVKDLVAGSRLTFEDRGVHTLKGLPGEWHLYAVASA